MSEKTNRIAKVIASAGVCSRRDAERLIADGKVQVNGKLIDSPALNVSEQDLVTVNGQPIATQTKAQVFKLYKPRGYLCTNKDPQGRATIFDLLPKNLPRLISVGRLDFNSEGLLLLTTDNALATKLMRPDLEIPRTYRIRIDGNLDKQQVAQIEQGLTIEGVRYRPAKIQIEVDSKKRNSWVTLTLTEGKNREIRKIMEHFGLKVSRLIRTDYANVSLGKMQPKALLEVPFNQLKKLQEL